MDLVRAGRILAVREGEGGDYFFDRLSIDAYFDSLASAGPDNLTLDEKQRAMDIVHSLG